MALLESENIEMGTPAPNFSLMGTDDQKHTLAEFKGKKALVVVFMCNHCPYVQAQWGRLVSLQERFKESGVQFIGINPNSNPDYPEDSFEKMKEYYKEYNMNFPYLVDSTQEVARAFGAQCTPDIFVYDQDQKLAYHGRIDDNWKDAAAAESHELAAALQALVDGEEISMKQNPSMGCSIKWLDS